MGDEADADWQAGLVEAGIEGTHAHDRQRADADEGRTMSARVEAAMRFKKALLDLGRDRGKGKCPYCEAGRWHGYIVGRRKHLHVRCDGCNFSMME